VKALWGGAAFVAREKNKYKPARASDDVRSSFPSSLTLHSLPKKLNYTDEV
jgi:hypothetical protein